MAAAAKGNDRPGGFWARFLVLTVVILWTSLVAGNWVGKYVMHHNKKFAVAQEDNQFRSFAKERSRLRGRPPVVDVPKSSAAPAAAPAGSSSPTPSASPKTADQAPAATPASEHATPEHVAMHKVKPTPHADSVTNEKPAPEPTHATVQPPPTPDETAASLDAPAPPKPTTAASKPSVTAEKTTAPASHKAEAAPDSPPPTPEHNLTAPADAAMPPPTPALPADDH